MKSQNTRVLCDNKNEHKKPKTQCNTSVRDSRKSGSGGSQTHTKQTFFKTKVPKQSNFATFHNKPKEQQNILQK